MVFADSTKIIHQIPLANIGVEGAVILEKSADSTKVSKELKVMSYLVVKKSLLSETTIIFVCTTFGTYNEKDNGKIAGYAEYNPGFEDYMILSDISGLYLASYMYHDGAGDWATMELLSKEELPQEFTGFLFIEDNANDSSSAKTRVGGVQDDTIYGGEFEEVVVVAQRKPAEVVPPDPWTPTDWKLLIEDIGGGAPSGNGGGAPSIPSVGVEDVTYSLELRARGNGSVSPAGISTHYEGSSVTIMATPNNTSTVFTGWFGQDITDHNLAVSIKMNSNRCITGTFYPIDSDCGKLALKYRNNDAMNRYLNLDLRQKILTIKNVEHGVLISSTGEKRYVVDQTKTSASFAPLSRELYKEAHHSHPERRALAASPADLFVIVDMYNDNQMSSPNGFIFTISNSYETIALEVENITKYMAFAKKKGFDTKENLEYFGEYYKDSIIRYTGPADYDANGADRVIEWLLKNDSGIKVSKGILLVQSDGSKVNDWGLVAFENNKLKDINCMGL